MSEEIIKIRVTTYGDLIQGFAQTMCRHIPYDAKTYIDDLNNTIEIVWEDNDAERSSASDDEESAGQEDGEEKGGSSDAAGLAGCNCAQCVGIRDGHYDNPANWFRPLRSADWPLGGQ